MPSKATKIHRTMCFLSVFLYHPGILLDSDVCYPQASWMQDLTLSLPMTDSGVYTLFYLGSYGVNILSVDIALLVACKPMAYAVNFCYQS